MPQLWAYQASTWQAHPVDDEQGLALALESPGRLRPLPPGREAAVLIRRVVTAGGEQWLLLSSARDVRVNGIPMRLGVKVLHDRDEIHVGGLRCVLSLQRRPRRGVWQPGWPARCARCSGRFTPGDAAVRCPHCGGAYHESDDLPCWSYHSVCAVPGCNHATRDEVFWTPEGL